MAERAYIVTKGVVLRETETKEADKILTLLTADRGKISVIARGVRRKSCKYAACAQQLVYSEWTSIRRASGTTPMKEPRRNCSTACGRIWRRWPRGRTRGADRDRHGAGGPCRGTAAPSAERAVRPLRFTEAAGTGEARL